MRMWMVNPKLMCRKHLLGEHVELHMLVGHLKRNKSIQGFMDKGLLEPQRINGRHHILVKEILERGYKHKSPLKYESHLKGQVDSLRSIKELKKRCPECRRRIKGGLS